MKKLHTLFFTLCLLFTFNFLTYADDGIRFDSKRGLISSDYGIITGNTENNCTWYKEHGFWKLRYLDGSFPCGDIYFEEDGVMKEWFAWEKVDGKWYAFELNGYMMTGWIYDSNYNHYYYLDSSGAMLLGDYIVDGITYHFDIESGHLLD